MTTLFDSIAPRVFEPKKRQVKVFQDKFRTAEIPLPLPVIEKLEAEVQYPYPHQVAAIGMMFPVPVPKDAIKDMAVTVKKDAGSHVILEQARNLVVSFETASGKTFLAKLFILKHAGKGTAFYTCPFKSLADEKYNEMLDQFGSMYKIGIMTGDFYRSGNEIDGMDLIITTFEKLDSLLRNSKEKIANKISCLVIDEIHFMNTDRGMVIDDLIAKIKTLKGIPIMAMSATIGNAVKIASWLNASLLESKFRPVPFKMGTIDGNEIEYEDGTFEKFDVPKKDTLEKIIGMKLVAGEQIMYVRQSRPNAEAFAKRMKQELASFMNNDMELPVIKTSEEEELNRCIKHGIAWHHSGVVQENRAYIEENFKNGNLRFICATTTLGAGINLPAKYVFLDWKRFSGYGNEPLLVGEAFQILHRAGRPQYDDMGHGILVCSKKDDYDYCVNTYYDAKPESIHSPFFDDSNYLYHSIVGNIGNYVSTRDEIMALYKNTFAFVERPSMLESMVGTTLRSFKEFEEPLVQESDGVYSLTGIGAIVKRYYVNPDDAMIIVKMIKTATTLSNIAIVHAALRCKTLQPVRNIKGGDDYWHDIYLRCKASLFYDAFNINDDLEWKSFQTAYMLVGAGLENEMIYADEEVNVGQLCYHYGILGGDLQRIVGIQGNFSWILSFAETIASYYKKYDLLHAIDEIATRLRYAISAKLVQLCYIKGIGKERGKALFKIGYCDIESIAEARISDIAEVLVNDKKIGASLAEGIVQSARGVLSKNRRKA